VPVLFMQGLAGSFFKPLILAYVLAIMASLLVAMTVTPALCLAKMPLSRPGISGPRGGCCVRCADGSWGTQGLRL